MNMATLYEPSSVCPMSANKASSCPRAFLFFDTETIHNPENPDQQILDFGYMEYVRCKTDKGSRRWSNPKGKHFYTVDEFWDEVERLTTPKTRLWVGAHNLGGFDINVLGGLQPLLDRGWRQDLSIIECPPFIIDMKKDTRCIRLFDTLNYVRSSLKKIGKSVGLEKLEDPGSALRAEREAYCRRDVEILRRFMIEGWWPLVREHDMGNFGMTAAHQAMNAFRHRFAPRLEGSDDLLDIHPTNGEESAFEQSAYYGGRTEAFFLGSVDQPVYYYDVNSLYPFVMKNNTYPVEMIDVGDSLNINEAVQMLQQGDGLIAETTIQTDVPLYPRMNRKDSRLEFPTGTWTMNLASPELRLALERGHVVRIGRWQRYRMQDIFSGWVDEFYALRRKYKDEGNGLWSDICKNILNSLYGKFGQRVPSWTVVKENELDFLEEGAMLQPGYSFCNGLDGITRYFRKWGHVVEERGSENRERASKAFPAIAAHVTSYARLVLLSAIETAGSKNVFYCDTDSVFVNDEGKANLERSGLLDNAKLGLWKLEDHSPNAIIYGLKDYVFKGKPKRKGVRFNAVEIKPGLFEQDEFRTFRGNILHQTEGVQIVKRVRKTLSRIYTKGVVGDDGWVIPHNINEEDPCITEASENIEICVLGDGCTLIYEGGEKYGDVDQLGDRRPQQTEGPAYREEHRVLESVG